MRRGSVGSVMFTGSSLLVPRSSSSKLSESSDQARCSSVSEAAAVELFFKFKHRGKEAAEAEQSISGLGRVEMMPVSAVTLQVRVRPSCASKSC